jgi:hypothetical protein
VQVLVLVLVPTSVHGEPTNPPPVSDDEKVTVPIGTDGALADSSVTVAVHDVEAAAATVPGAHEAEVVVGWLVTVRPVVLLLAECFESPP